jgi:hypothetical protein
MSSADWQAIGGCLWRGDVVKLTACHVVMLQLGKSVFSGLGVKISEDRQELREYGVPFARYYLNKH